MKLQRQIAIWSGVVSVIALLLSYFLNLYGATYASGIFVGLFSSGILICIVSIITYFNERDKTLYSLYCGCYDFLNSLNSNMRPNNIVPLEDIRRNFESMVDTYDKSVYYNLCKLTILLKGTKLQKIVLEIWEAVRHIYLFVVDDKSKLMRFYLGEMTKEELEKSGWKYTHDDSIAYVKELQEVLDKLAYHMNYYNVRKGKKDEVNDNAD